MGGLIARRVGLLAMLAVVTGMALSACGSGSTQGEGVATSPSQAVSPSQVVKGLAGADTSDAEPESGACDSQPCAVGRIGPGGGVVFFDAGSEQPWGRFLEVAPAKWAGGLDVDPAAQWCPMSSPGYATKLAAGTDVGAGFDNTYLIIDECGATTSAAGLAASYEGGGMTDWFLPSRDELHALQVYVRVPQQRANVQLWGQDMWSSSQGYGSTYAWHETFRGSGYQTDNAYKDQQAFVRPIRAFSDPLGEANATEGDVADDGDAPTSAPPASEPDADTPENAQGGVSIPSTVPTRTPGRPPAQAKACKSGGACVIGDTGPGGGVVFYDAGSQQPWGRYLEAAPAGWSGAQDLQGKWCPNTKPGFNNSGGAAGIGLGKANSAWMLGPQGQCGSRSAAGLATTYRGGGKDDWFLPSKDELDELYQQRDVVGGFSGDEYWSSTQDFEQSPVLAWFQFFDSGEQYSDQNKTFDFRVRPIRAF